MLRFAGNMPDPNKHGLTRASFDDAKKRLVRQACGFGCVICGEAPYDYDHTDPEFDEAHEHDPARINLLCGTHHAQKTRGRLSAETIFRHRANPRALQQGYARETLDCGTGPFSVIIGGAWFHDCERLLTVHGRVLLGVAPPEAPGAPVRLTAILHDRDGQLICEIVDNEMRFKAANWDVVSVGRVFTFRSQTGDVALRLTTNPGRGIYIDKLDMRYGGRRIEADADMLRLDERATFRGGTMFQNSGIIIQRPRIPPIPRVTILWKK